MKKYYSIHHIIHPNILTANCIITRRTNPRAVCVENPREIVPGWPGPPSHARVTGPQPGRSTDNTESPWILLPVAIRRGKGEEGRGTREEKGEVTRGEWIGSSV